GKIQSFTATGDLGFEPRLTDPESVVLPLHQSPRDSSVLDRVNQIVRISGFRCKPGRKGEPALGFGFGPGQRSGMVQKRVTAQGWLGSTPEGQRPQIRGLRPGGSLAVARSIPATQLSSPARLAKRVITPHAPMTLGGQPRFPGARTGVTLPLLVISGLATGPPAGVGDGLRFLSTR